MNRKSKIFFAVTIVLFVLSFIPGMLFLSNVEQSIFKKAPVEAVKLAEDTLINFANGETDKIFDSFTNQVKSQTDLSSGLESISDFVRNLGEIKSQELIGYQGNYFNGQQSHAITYELAFSDRYVAYTAQIAKENNVFKIHRVDFNYYPISLKETNGFNLWEKSELHFMALILAVSILLFTLYTAALCFGTVKEKKWRKSLFILCGIGTIALNWTTGELGFDLLSIHIPVATLNKAGSVAPFILSMNFPLGALFYWGKWRKETNEDEIESTNDDIDYDDIATNDGL